MENAIRIELDNGIHLQVTIISADVFAEQPGKNLFIEQAGQCWVVKLKVTAKGISIKGWAFMSSLWLELLFQRNPTHSPPPHFLSRKPVVNSIENDLLTDLADHVDIAPNLIATSIIGLLKKIIFVFPGLYACGNDFHACRAKSFRSKEQIYHI